MAAKPFQSTYLQMCPQSLVEVLAGAQTHDICATSTALYTTRSARLIRNSKTEFELKTPDRSDRKVDTNKGLYGTL